MPQSFVCVARCLLLSLVGVVLCGVVLGGCATSGTERPPPNFRPPPNIDTLAVKQAIRDVLEEQVDAWNRGDLEGFMQGYARTDTLRFASRGSVRTGWQTTLERYRQAYPDRAAMGRLTFSDVSLWVLSPREALVFGRWRLQRAEDAPNGLFTLLMQEVETDDGTAWRIVHDHTSSAQE